MFRIARKSALLLATLTASLSISSATRADNSPQQYQAYQQYVQPANNQPTPYPPTQYQQNSNQQYQQFAPVPPQNNQQFQNQNQQYQNQQFQNQNYQQTSNNTNTQSVSAENRLSDEQLGAALAQLGYNPQPVQTTTGSTSYTMKIERGDWKFSVFIGLSPDKTNVWMTQNLSKLPQGNVSAAALLKVLQWNSTTTAMFSFNAESNQLTLAKPFANRDLGPNELRTYVENFIKTIQDTESLWSEKALAATNATPNATAMR